MPTARGIAVLTIIALAVAVSQSFGRFTYSVLLTDIRDDLGISNTIAGTLGSTNLAGYLLGTLVVSLVVGRVGIGPVAQVGLVAVTAGLALLAWSPGVLVVGLGLGLTGFMAAGVWVTAPAIATEQLGLERRGLAIGITSLGVGSGTVIAAALDTAVAWRTVYRIEVVIALVAVIASLSLVRGPPRRMGTASGLAAMRAVPGWRALLGAYGTYGAAIAVVMTFLVAVLEDDAGYSSRAATGAFVALAVCSVFGGPLYGVVIDRFGRRIGLVSANVAIAGSALVIATGHRPGATIAAAVFGTSFTGVPVAVGARIADHNQGAAFGAAFGVATLAFGVGLAAGPQLGGALADAVGSFRPAFVIAAAASAVGAVLSMRAVPRHDGGPR